MHNSAIGPYRLLEPLGHGGMGIVYRARHAVSEHVVALKTVRVPAPRWIDGIRREIQALTRVRHPGVVRILEHGVHEGRPWYAMDLLEGESLRRHVQRVWSPYQRIGPPASSTQPAVSATSLNTETLEELQSGAVEPARGLGEPGKPPAAAGALPQCLAIMRRVCATLAFLHGEGFINCDLKPENILLAGGQPVIIDFGLAARYPGGSSREELEAHHRMAGTLLYMAPEQIRGEFADARADLYSIGCIIYELVVGRPPFGGAQRALVHQHLSEPPVPPSALVSNLPQALEALILKLLEKDVQVRSAYADEVAEQLARLGAEADSLRSFPRPRAYLYRSRLVGRDEQLADLARLRTSAMGGRGSFVLLGGESGAGKTRLAMELIRRPPGPVVTITSEAFAAPPSVSTSVRGAPLNAIRPLLRAIADRCQEGGPSVTERLIGHRRALLAKYEPLLAHVPVASVGADAASLDSDGSRQQIFKYLAESLASLAREKPILWVLDDVNWADELSLSFLQSLSATFFQSTALMLVCTHRSEEPSDAIAALKALPHVVDVHLPRLHTAAIRSMLGDMLALDRPPGDFASYLEERAEGNPFFAAEFLRAAVSERLVFRDKNHAWQFLSPRAGEQSTFQAITLPSSLRALIERRVNQLSPAAENLLLVGAVLAKQFELELLYDVAATSGDVRVSATDELLRRNLLEQVEPGVARFTHDQIREVVYQRAAPPRLVAVHARAAEALAGMIRGRADASSHWASISYHFAAAGNCAEAARFAKAAADHARDTFANADAIRLYQDACRHTLRVLAERDDAEWRETLLDLHEALGDILLKTTRRAEARQAYEEAQRQAPGERLALRSRLYRKVGKTWEGEHEHEQALNSYAAAKAVLGAAPSGAAPELLEPWIEVHIDELWVHYWLNRVEAMDAIIAKLSPFITECTPLQRARFFQSQMLLRFRCDRYLVTDQTLAYGRAAVDACRAGGAGAELPAAQLVYGLALLFKNSLQEAEAELLPVLELAQRVGDQTLEARCLTYLGLGARLQSQTERVAAYTRQASEVARAGGMLEYIGAARANESWLELRAGRLRVAAERATEALLAWNNRVFPFRWMALLPLLEAELTSGSIERAIDCARQLLAPTQQRLPGTAATALSRALEAWSVDRVDDAQAALRSALGGLTVTGYR